MKATIEKSHPSNKFVIDNSGCVCICEASFEEDGSEWGKLKFLRIVKEFDSVDEAEAFADQHDMPLWGEISDWSFDL
ncbi:hypothetical protein [Serratia sp. Se-RSBMAAmG]|uniref:hypothetical protein n=1 Tax=Serratia sp. Se-RSBMAAmG TaxID=3043305 RepID=UPI0024AEA481|nr:hypothetical protein [Serratia sp. Se-RSBMAAmG]MDI6977278.1 hypothetical protein [Serratia sp. Se-RSBMAAmG]